MCRSQFPMHGDMIKLCHYSHSLCGQVSSMDLNCSLMPGYEDFHNECFKLRSKSVCQGEGSAACMVSLK